MKTRLIAVVKFTSKAGKPLCQAYISTEFSPADVQKGCFGEKIETIWVPEEQHDYLKPEHIGKEVTMDYIFYNGAPRVSAIHVIEK